MTTSRVLTIKDGFHVRVGHRSGRHFYGIMKNSVIFDFGGVLIDWDPRHLYRKLIGDEETMERFLSSICTNEWQAKQNVGKP